MQQPFQFVSNVCEFASNYVTGLLKTFGPKNVESMSRSTGISRSKLYQEQSLDSNKFKDALLTIAQEGTKNQYTKLVFDGTTVQKPYGKTIENITYDRNACSGYVERCLSIVASFVCTSKKAFPLNFHFWRRNKDAGNQYLKKTDLAFNLLNEAYAKIKIHLVLMDGGFCCTKILKQIYELGLEYIARFPRGRKITINNVTDLIQNHSCFQMTRNQRYIVVEGFYQNMPCRFVAHKRKGRNGKNEVIFYITNKLLSAKKLVKLYAKRWKIEKGFRTTKQKIGLADCQSRSLIKQTNHILSVFLAYSISMLKTSPLLKNSVDCYLNFIRQKEGQKSPCLKRRKYNRMRTKRHPN